MAHKALCCIEFLWFPHNTQEKEKPIYSFEQAMNVIDQFGAMESEPATKNHPVAWATVVLKNENGDRLHVGKSDVGWLLIQRNASERTHILRSEGVKPGPRVVFLIPEWTDFERADLVPLEKGESIIKEWLCRMKQAT